MGRPIIGITGELEAARWRTWIREAVVSPVSYTRAVERAGGTPVVLPPVPASSVPGLIARIDALLVAGGRDIDPSLYDEAPHEQTDQPDHRRDRFELLMTRAAIEADLPFLAICRGMQLLNVARGGTLIQHLPDRIGNDSHKPDPVKLTTHDVQISPASKLSRILGTSAQVPAAHHQAIDRIGSGLLTVAWTLDQVVEAIELQGHRWGLGVQWNPEDGDDPRLFEALVTVAKSAAAQAAAQPQPEVTARSKRSAKRHPARSSSSVPPISSSSALFLVALGRGAARAAGAEGAGPATAAQDRGDLCGGPAAVLGGVGPPVPQRLRSLHEVGVVSVSVAPAAFRRVGRDAVQFDAYPVFFVQVVQVAVTAAVPAHGLAPRQGQAVGALHTVDVVALQRGMDAIGSVLHGVGDPGAPAHPRARRECLAEQFGGGEAAADRGRDPAVGVIEGPRRADQVEDRIFDRGPRQ